MGVSLAALCPAFGYRFEAVVDPKTPKGCVERMRTLGAVVHTVSGADEMGNYLQSRLALVRELCAHGRRTWVDQYSNPANPLAHYSTTAPEVLQQMQGRLDAVFIAVGTGGTLAGVARYMRESSPSTVVVAVDTPGSVIFGGPPAPRRLSGIGSARPSDFIEPRLYDRVAMVSDHIAFSFCRRVERSCGFRLGGSSAAAVLAAAEYAAQHPAADRMVVICADDGRDYATSIFDDAWLANQSVPIDLTEPAYISDVLYFRSPIKFGTDLPLDPPTLLP
jgi:cysteine synthase A